MRWIRFTPSLADLAGGATEGQESRCPGAIMNFVFLCAFLLDLGGDSEVEYIC